MRLYSFGRTTPGGVVPAFRLLHEISGVVLFLQTQRGAEPYIRTDGADNPRLGRGG